MDFFYHENVSHIVKTLKKLWATIQRTPLVTLGVLLIIVVAIPLTVNLGTHTTNDQQHASTTPNNWCNSQNPSNAKGICGAHGWGLCRTKSNCDTGKNTFDSQSGGGACRGFDNNSGCCYPKTTPLPGYNSNPSGLCGGNGYGMCFGQSNCVNNTDYRTWTAQAKGSNAACDVYSNHSANFGCCYPTNLPSQKPSCSSSGPYCGDGICNNGETSSSCPKDCGSGGGPPPPNQAADTIYDHLDGANCSTGISGWVCQNNYFDQANTVHLYADNPFSSGGKHLYPNTVANIDKSSISSLCGGTTKHAFVFPASQLIHDGKEHSYYLYGIDLSGKNNNPLLYPSPVKVTCTTSTPPTPTPTHTPTPTPTQGSTPTPTIPPSSHQTTLSLAIQLPGIGIGGNLSPKRKNRIVHISIYKADVDPSQPNITPILDDKTIHLSYQSNTGYFTNDNVVLKQAVATGDYQLLIKTQGYLRKEFKDTNASADTIHITEGTKNLVPLIKLTPGDTAPLSNVMDASDFYAIVNCYKDKASTSSCAAGSQITDLNDDGVIDGVDLNLWLEGFQAVIDNNGNGDGARGD